MAKPLRSNCIAGCIAGSTLRPGRGTIAASHASRERNIIKLPFKLAVLLLAALGAGLAVTVSKGPAEPRLIQIAQRSSSAPPTAPQKEPEPSAIINVEHSPREPRSGQAVTISAQPRAAARAMTLEYQVVEPGGYIALKDKAYASSWTAAPMSRLADGRFSAQLPGSLQSHRRLVRYRFQVTSEEGREAVAPPPDSPEPNHAYFVYDGIPPWRAAIQPGASGQRGEAVTFGPAVMGQVQNYFLLSSQQSIENTTWREQNSGSEYRHTGTLVANGEVYDHIRMRARGGVWRFAMGKNMWKFDFNKGHPLQAQDDYGEKYKVPWGKLNLRACIQQGDYGRRGEQGMYESVGFRLFNLAGVPAPHTHWIALRIIDGAEESPANQYEGDFWGLYLAIENEDGRFLEQHGLPDGNFYKMMHGQGELEHLGQGQPEDGSDIRQFISGYSRSQSEEWWRKNFDLPGYYSYRAIVEGIHHYDIADGKNYNFYRHPETGRWQVIPWDIDLTWGDHMYGRGVGAYEKPILTRPAFRAEMFDRFREIHDLLFNSDETGRLIDECAALISRPAGLASIVDADRAKWDYHPIMESRYAMREKAGKGLFYKGARGGDFAGMVRQMKEYAAERAPRLKPADQNIPAAPSITYSGAPGFPSGGLTFRSSPFSGLGAFAAMQWRVGEIDPAIDPYKKPARRGKYEITPVWESGELAAFQESIRIPAGVLQPGQTYRARVRMKDQAGRWSHWSAPAQFVAGQ